MDLQLVGDTPDGWESFTAWEMGMGEFLDRIMYVLTAPSCSTGSILAIGTNLCGPGGDGPYALESTLVLAASFPRWLAHLERWGWVEPAITGGGEFSEQEQKEISGYYLALNPQLEFGTA
jgi:hypothetical protein